MHSTTYNLPGKRYSHIIPRLLVAYSLHKRLVLPHLSICRSLDTLSCLRAALLHKLLDRAHDEEISRQEQWKDQHPEQAWPGVNSCP